MNLTCVTLNLSLLSCLLQSHLLWSIATCLIWGILISFSMAPVFDVTAYHRMRQKNGWSYMYFHVGNVLLHFVPAMFTVLFPPCEPVLWHGVAAATVHITWTCLASGFDISQLGQIYIPLRTVHWIQLSVIGIATELYTPVYMIQFNHSNTRSGPTGTCKRT